MTSISFIFVWCYIDFYLCKVQIYLNCIPLHHEYVYPPSPCDPLSSSLLSLSDDIIQGGNYHLLGRLVGAGLQGLLVDGLSQASDGAVLAALQPQAQVLDPGQVHLAHGLLLLPCSVRNARIMKCVCASADSGMCAVLFRTTACRRVAWLENANCVFSRCCCCCCCGLVGDKDEEFHCKILNLL